MGKHAPIKQAYQRRMKLPCMNSSLKKAIFIKNKFLANIKNSNSKTWEEICVGGIKSDNL